MNDIRDIIDKLFKDDRAIFFHQSDRHLMEEPNAYLRYQYKDNKLWLYFGSDNGEYLLLITDKAEGLEDFIWKIMKGI
jgi:hypothetical protein